MTNVIWRGGVFFPSLFAIVLCIFAGCSGNEDRETSDERVYAVVNGSQLTESELRTLVPAGFYDRLSTAHKKEIIQEWVNSELLYQEACRQGIDGEPRIARIIEKSRRDLLSAEIMTRKIVEITRPTDTVLKGYYDENSDLFRLQSDEYVVRYALFDTMDDAKDFYNKVKRGVSFSELAETESKDTSAKDGGSLGAVNETSVESAVWSEIVRTHGRLGLRKISDPFRVIDGFAIVIVDEVYRAGTLKPFEHVRDQVLDYYMMDRREEEKNAFIHQLASQADIQYHF